jgi:hypothetical protein
MLEEQEQSSACQSEACSYDFGSYDTTDCAASCANYHSHDCSQCLHTCPVNTFPNSNHICYPITDFSSKLNPAVYAVKQDYEGYFGGKTLKEVLQKLWMKYNEVQLQEAISVLGDSVADNEELFTSDNLVRVMIKTVLCTNSLTTHCLNSPAEIRLNSPSLSFKAQTFELQFEAVGFEGKYSLVNDCNDDRCTYCPHLIEHSSRYYDDRYTEYSVKPDWPDCSSSQDLSFISASKDLQLTQVTFNNFRQGFLHLIKGSASITFKDVSFDNIAASSQASSTVVSLSCSMQDKCDFSYLKGKVSRLNNGFELIDTSVQSGFLYLYRANKVVIAEVDFKMSTVFIGSNVENSNNYLISVENCKETLTLTDITFTSVLTTDALVYVNALTVEYPLNQSNRERQALLKASHVKMSRVSTTDCRFRWLLQVEFRSILQNVEIETLSATNSASYGGLISVLNIYAFTEIDAIGGITAYDDGTYQNIVKPPCFLKLTGLTIKRVYWDLVLVNLVFQVNITVKDVVLTNSGSFSGGLHEFAYDALKTDPEIYLSNDSNAAATLNCLGGFSSFGTRQVSISGLSFADSSCSGTLGIEMTSHYYKVGITDSKFTNISSNSSSAGLIAVQGFSSSNLSIERVTMEKVVNNYGKGCVFTSVTTYSAKDCSVKNVTSRETAGFTIAGSSSVTLNNVKFEGLNSTGDYGGCLNIYFSNDVNTVSISSSSFVQCSASAYSGGAIYMEFAPVSLDMQIISTMFNHNYAKISGSAIFLERTVNLASASKIESCDFINNTSENRAVLYLALMNSIALSNLTFTGNKGGQNIVYMVHEVKGLSGSFSGVTLRNNQADNIINVEGRDSDSSLTFTNVIIENNQGSVGEIKSLTMQGFSIKLIGNTNPLVMTGVHAQWTDLEARDAVVGADISVLEVLSDSSFNCTSCIFTNNRGFDGVIQVDSSEIFLDKGTFTGNYGETSGSILYMTSSRRNLIRETTFRNNTCMNIATIYMIESALVLQNIVMDNNSAADQTPGLSLQNSQLEVYDSQFSNQHGIYSAYFVLFTQSLLKIQRSSFRGVGSDSEGAVCFMASSFLEIVDCTISDMQSQIIAAQTLSNVTIVNTEISQIYTKTFPTISASASYLVLRDVTIHHYSGQAVYVLNMQGVTVERTTIECKL